LILSFDGANHAILCLQMHLMCWDVNIIYQNDQYLMNTDYWSQLGANLYFNPLFKTYLELTWSFCLENPAPSSLPMKPKNFPYYHGPHVITSNETADSSNTAHSQAILSMVMINNYHGLCHLSSVPIKFGNFGKMTPPNAWHLNHG
jgi:hypothetical protein